MFIPGSIKTNSLVPKFRQTDMTTCTCILFFHVQMSHKTRHAVGVRHISYTSTGNVEITLCQERATVLLGIWLPASVARQHSGVTIKGRRVPSILNHYVTSQYWEPNTCITASYAIGTQPSSTQLEKHENSHIGNVVQYNTHI